MVLNLDALIEILDILCGSGIFLTVSELIEGSNVMFSKTLEVEHRKHTVSSERAN